MADEDMDNYRAWLLQGLRANVVGRQIVDVRLTTDDHPSTHVRPNDDRCLIFSGDAGFQYNAIVLSLDDETGIVLDATSFAVSNSSSDKISSEHD